MRPQCGHQCAHPPDMHERYAIYIAYGVSKTMRVDDTATKYTSIFALIRLISCIGGSNISGVRKYI